MPTCRQLSSYSQYRLVTQLLLRQKNQQTVLLNLLTQFISRHFNNNFMEAISKLDESSLIVLLHVNGQLRPLQEHPVADGAPVLSFVNEHMFSQGADIVELFGNTSNMGMTSPLCGKDDVSPEH
ncbi:hypothetical protein Btru_076183 [Bulinus truncatus]|nr:hypothetical protein Btru_076183 [Bulinus truncatus]